VAVTEVAPTIGFETDPTRYRHWRLSIDPPIATLTLDVQEDGGLVPGYVLKLNSYDLGVDIELADAVQRLRFEHPEVRAVIITSGNEKVFCAGANIGMLAQSAHGFKVNFCKFTNETRLAIEDASANSGQTYICAINGTASGGGYELALACEHLVLVDDGSSAVSLPELPLLAVLPGTGGLTRLTDKRGVRRDLADAFATKAEGVKGLAAVEWGLVDETVPRSKLDNTLKERALALAAKSTRPDDEQGVPLGPVDRSIEGDSIAYGNVKAELDRSEGVATIMVNGPASKIPDTIDDSFWPLAAARELDDLILHLRFNEPEVGTLVMKTSGDPVLLATYDEFMLEDPEWIDEEIVLLWKRTLKRLDLTSRSIIALIEPDSCFTGTLAELAFAADRSYMLDEEGSMIRLTPMNFGPLPMSNGLTRLESRRVTDREDVIFDAQQALGAGLVTFVYDDLDWEDEVRLAIEERASFSPDALTAMEANLRFSGPETTETKIFGRLSTWQNWVFSRPNATGAEGALPRYGTGQRAVFDKRRV
jgi:benzoyl-CoA-dihydrodiol lyase